jgi:excisionase family DNA binding protein
MQNIETQTAVTSRLLTVKQACNQLQISRTHLYGLCKAGTIQAMKIGPRGVRIPSEEIDRFIREGTRA